METSEKRRNDVSLREAKYEALMEEVQYHGDISDIVKAIADELSWRVVMRVIHKLRRKRGVE